MLSQWWKGHDFPVAVDIGALPLTGLIIEEGDVALCAGWLYLSNSSIAWIGFVVGNPEIKAKSMYIAIKELMSGLVELAHESGFSIIYANFNKKGLLKPLADIGFLEAGKDYTEMIYKRR